MKTSIFRATTRVAACCCATVISVPVLAVTYDFSAARGSGTAVDTLLITGLRATGSTSASTSSVSFRLDAATGQLVAGSAGVSVTFSPVTGAPLNTVVSSNTVTISGLTAPAAVSITGGQYAIGGGSWTSSSGTINNGQTVQVRVTSSPSFNTTTTATLSVGGVTGSFSVSTPSITRVTSVNQVITNPDSAVSIASNGAVQISSSTTNYAISSSAPVDAAIILPTSSLNLTLGNQTLGHQAQTANTTMLVKTITVNGVSSKSLEVANGTVRITANSANQVMTAVQPTGAVSQGYLQSGSAASSATLSRDSGGNLIGEVSAGSTRYIRAGTGFSSATDTTVYAGETLKADRYGVVLKQWLGSSGRDQGKVGDALNASFTARIGLTVSAQIPKLAGTSTRTGTAKAVDAQLADALAAYHRVTLTSYSQDLTTGVLTLNHSAGSLRYLPLDTLDVDYTNNFSATGSVVANPAGTLKVLINGVYVTVAPGLYYPYLLAAVQGLDSRATVEIAGGQGSNLIYRVRNLGGLDYVVRPGFQATAASGTQAIPGFETVNGYVAFRDNTGALQTLYPVLLDLAAISATFLAVDPAFTITDNNDATVTARFQGNSYILKPSYNLMTTPTAHTNDLFWIEGATIYFKYTDNSAQGAGF